MSDGMLCLRWKNHTTTFQQFFSSARRKNAYADVTIACEGKFYQAHKIILSTCSNYFDQIFQDVKDKHPVIVLKDIKWQDVESLLDYMYIGEVNVAQHNLACFIQAAKCLRIKGLAVPDEQVESSLNASELCDTNLGPTKNEKVCSSVQSFGRPINITENFIERRPSDSIFPNSKRLKLEKECEPNIAENTSSMNCSETKETANSDSLSLDKVSDNISASNCSGSTNATIRPSGNSTVEASPPVVQVKQEHVDECDTPADTSTGVPGIVKQEPRDPTVFVRDGVEDTASSAPHQVVLEWGSKPSTDSILGIPTAREFTEYPEQKQLPPAPLDQLQSSGAAVNRTYGHQEKTNPALLPFDQLDLSNFTDYSCPVCGKYFDNKARLKVHYMIHTGERPFACVLCPYRARKNWDLSSHMKLKHSIAVPVFRTTVNQHVNQFREPENSAFFYGQ